MDPHNHLNLPAAPEWSLLVGILGRFSIYLAILGFVVSCLASAFRPNAVKLASRSFWVGACGLFSAFLALGALMVSNQFHFDYVFRHSSKGMGLGYDMAAIWSAQEGSFLLWAVTSAIFGVFALRRTGPYTRWFRFAYALFLASLAGILAYESPFLVNLINGQAVLPPNGLGMEPSLINYWIIIHPPTIFLGFGSLTVLYCWAFAALATRDMDAWIKMVRPWAIVSATLVGVGLCMGGFWAYETLGWGGFWAWDPVENTSFLPWLIVISLIHGAFVQVARNKWKFGNTLLAGLALISFLYGTFLTRSGYLQDMSVHSFASMDRSALRILTGVMGVFTFGFLGLWVARLREAKLDRAAANETPRNPLQLESFYRFGMAMLLSLGVAAGIGMSVPLFLALSGRSGKVVEEALYHKVLVWFVLPVFFLMAIGPYLTWRGAKPSEILARLNASIGLSLGLVGLTMIALKMVPEAYKIPPTASIPFPFGINVRADLWVLFLYWLCLFAVCGNLIRLGQMWRRARPSIGGVLTHVGVMVALAGLILSRGLEHRDRVVVQEGRPGIALGRLVSLAGRTKDYMTRENQVKFTMTDAKGDTMVVQPTLYYTQRPGSDEPKPVVRPDVQNHGWYDIYTAIGPMVFDVTEPITLAPGQTKPIEEAKNPADSTTVKYLGLRREGEVGATGTKFFADLEIKAGGKTEKVSPFFAITEAGPERDPVEVGEYLVTLERMDAGSKSATLQFFFKSPLYPLEIYYKPFTILVWVGTGIMALGGFWAAFNRRRGLLTPRPSATVDNVVEKNEPEYEATAVS